MRFFLEKTIDSAKRWRLAGHFQPFVKYFPPTHKIAVFGNQAYLLVTGQGEAGICINSKTEHWIDLADDDLKPVFSYTTEGHLCQDLIPDRLVTGVVTSVNIEGERRITVSYSVEFSKQLEDGPILNFGGRADKVVYVRSKGTGYEIDEISSTLGKEEVEQLYELGRVQLDQYLRYNFDDLQMIATAPNGLEKRWLRSFLRSCPETAEKISLERILHAPSKTIPRR